MSKRVFSKYRSKQIKTWFWMSTVATLLMAWVIFLTGQPLITDAVPLGILSFELAGMPEQAQAILADWGQRKQAIAVFNLGIDYIFAFFYGLTLLLGTVWAAKQFRTQAIAKLGVGITALMPLAVLSDYAENAALYMTVLEAGIDPWPQVAWVFAVIKFSLIALGLLYLFCGLFGRRQRRGSGKGSSSSSSRSSSSASSASGTASE